MTKLPKFLTTRRIQLDVPQKKVAARYVTALEKVAGAPRHSLNTVEPKLSKVLSGSAEGEDCFFSEASYPGLSEAPRPARRPKQSPID